METFFVTPRSVKSPSTWNFLGSDGSNRNEYIVLNDTLGELFSLVHQQTQTLNANNGQRDSEQIPFLQEGDKYEADTTAP